MGLMVAPFPGIPGGYERPRNTGDPGPCGATVGPMSEPALKEWAAGNRRKPPVYTLVAREGPDHAAKFTVSVEVKGVGTASATGSSKQDAETSAARAFMQAHG